MVDTNQQAAFSVNMPPPSTVYSTHLDEDGVDTRTGTVLTTSARIILAVIGSGVLSLPWSTAQLGWLGAAVALILFSTLSFCTSSLLAACYRTSTVTGKRNGSYPEAVKSILSMINQGGAKVGAYWTFQIFSYVGPSVGHTIACGTSMRAIRNMNSSKNSGEGHNANSDHKNIKPYMLTFGMIQIIISQFPVFHKHWLVSVFSGVLPAIYMSVCIYLGIVKTIENKSIKGNLKGISRGTGDTEKLWRVLESLGEIAYSFSFSNVFFEIQDMVKAPPSEEGTMRRASLLSVVVTTFCFMSVASVGYATFGDLAPNNLLTGFEDYKPHWLVVVAHVAVVLRLVRDYQSCCRPIFALVEKQGSSNGFRVLSRTLFVISTTMVSVLFPSFNDVVGLVGGLTFWPLSVYFPVEMYIKQKMIRKWSARWVGLQIFSFSCLVLTIGATAGSLAGLVIDMKASNKLSEN